NSHSPRRGYDNARSLGLAAVNSTSSGETLRRRTALRNAHQDSGETLRRRTALRNAHQDKS
ncbi:MAG: hypothetical protein HC800_14630, partial [Phormidesmis sp. RL_2_1]|nr:hypothetical protein [Phormidesmis sp. RL_2_1]